MTPRETTELLMRLHQILENRLDKIVPAGRHALHVVLLVLDRTQQHGIGQVVHLRHPPTRRTEQRTLRLGRTLDDVFWSPQKLSDEFRLVLVKGALQVRGQEPVLHVHAGSQALLGHPAQDERLVGGLLGVLAEHDDPTGVEHPVDVIVAAMHVERVLGQRSRAHLYDHRRRLAWRVIVLLRGVGQTLA